MHCFLLSRAFTEPNFNFIPCAEIKILGKFIPRPLFKPFMFYAQSAKVYMFEVLMNRFDSNRKIVGSNIFGKVKVDRNLN